MSLPDCLFLMFGPDEDGSLESVTLGGLWLKSPSNLRSLRDSVPKKWLFSLTLSPHPLLAAFNPLVHHSASDRDPCLLSLVLYTVT